MGGEKLEGTSGRFGPIFNPSTGKQVGKVALASKAEVETVIENAHNAFAMWSATSVVKRARVIQNLVQVLYRRKDELAEALSREHGKVFF